MTDNATSRYKARKQSVGSNTNTWGDANLNDNLDLFDHGSKGVDSITMTGDYTMSWSNYDTSSEANVGQCSILLLAGSLSSAANLTVPSVEWSWDLIKNSTGQTITVKTSAGTGVSIPNGRQIPIYCDGSDCYYAGANLIGSDISEANNRDLADRSYVDTAIATATVPATTGTSLNSGADTTAGYLRSKLTASVTGLTTTQLAGLTSVQLSTVNAAANEQTLITIGSGYVNAFLPGGTKSSTFVPVVGYSYNCDFSTASFTVSLSGMTTPQIEQKIHLNCFGNNPPFLLGTINGQTNIYLDAGFNGVLQYSSASWGWN